MLRLGLLLSLAACTTADPIAESPDAGEDTPLPSTIEVTLDHLEPGWSVTTTRMTGSDVPKETTQISDGTAITLSGSADDVFVAVVTDDAGNVVETRSMGAPCTLAPARRRDVPTEYATIQQAINAAQPGDTVKVAPGTYRESLQLRPGVCLLGSGAMRTTLASDNSGLSLVSLTKAPGSVVAGFTLRGVRTGALNYCRNDPFTCSGNWYAAAIHIMGLEWEDATQDAPPLIFNNIFTDNDIGVLMYWRSVATVRSNIFVANTNGLVANHFQGRAYVANNVFFDNTDTAIGNQAAYLDIINNVIVGSKIGIAFEYIQTGSIRCNLFSSNQANQRDVYAVPERFTIGTNGNVDVPFSFIDPTTWDFHLPSNSPGTHAGCFTERDGTPQDVGAFGGPLATWLE